MRRLLVRSKKGAVVLVWVVCHTCSFVMLMHAIKHAMRKRVKLDWLQNEA